MKKFLSIVIAFLMIIVLSSCSIKNDDLENATIYTTEYPVNYLVNYMYSDYGKISSIYPKETDINNYKLTEKQIDTFANGDLFVYNGLTNEKDIAKTLLNKNKYLLIIDVSYGLSLNDDIIELWLSPNNYLMLAKNIKDNLIDIIKSKLIIDSIEEKYLKFEEKISIMDASLHTIGKNAKENNKNTLIVSNNGFKYLENYGFNVISLEDEDNLKEYKLNSIKSNFNAGHYKYILVANGDEENEIIKELKEKNKAELIKVDTLTNTLTTDYFDIMTDYIDNISNICK